MDEKEFSELWGEWLGGKTKTAKTSGPRPWVNYVQDTLDWKAAWEAGYETYGDGATWWIQATEGVNYYRGKMPAKHLPGRWVKFESRDLQEHEGEAWFPRQIGNSSIWLFAGNRTRAICMAELHLQGHRVLLEVDDNYTMPPPTVPGLNSGWANARKDTEGDPHSFAYHRIIAGAEYVSGIIVSTPKLAEVYERFGKPVYVCPNSIDLGDWDGDPPHQPDEVLRIGWAGSTSHTYDLADIRPALDWASRQRGVEVVVLGELDLGRGVSHRVIPWTDSLAEYRQNMQQLDVILCSTRPGEWADCKSDVKALEGVMGGSLPVVSRTEPYRPWWDKGYVAETTKDFTKIVKHLIQNRDEIKQAYEDARKYVLEERLIEQNIDAWRQACEIETGTSLSSRTIPTMS